MGVTGPHCFANWVQRFAHPLRQPNKYLWIRCTSGLYDSSKILKINYLLVALGGKPKVSW